MIDRTFLLVDGVKKSIKTPPVVHATLELGYPESSIIGLGILLFACVVRYVIAKTSLLGAILLTGYLDGCRDARGSPLFTHTLFLGAGFFQDDRMRMLIGL